MNLRPPETEIRRNVLRGPAAYSEDYFLRGEDLGLSCYTNYRWMPGTTYRMATAILDHLDTKGNETFLDFGCARGYLVRALHEQGFEAFGVDLSVWAVENADKTVRSRISPVSLVRGLPVDLPAVDWIIAKDVLEHIEPDDLVRLLRLLWSRVKLGLFVVVPVSGEIDGPYLSPRDEYDVTHLVRWPAWAWLRAFLELEGAYVRYQSRLKGIKDHIAASSPGSVGIFTVTRRERNV